MRKLLVANRGEIAIRVVRAARELGIPTVAVCSEPDVEALHARAADEHVVIGPAAAARSYLDVDAVLEAAAEVGADAVHPGDGFLSERADFAERLDQAGVTFVGPTAQAEAAAAFGHGEVYLERFVEHAHHVEVQVFGDGSRFLHLGERECSLQRRRQKILEEAPSPSISEQVREAMTTAAVRLPAEVSYRGAGTVEFLYDPDHHDFFFIEMNTRIQVEHPITEMVTGRDLVREQLSVAAGNPLSFTQEDVEVRGHSIELRLNAEDPTMQFMPSPGPLEVMRMPAGPFVRIDSGYEQGSAVSPYYDSLLAKGVVWDDN